MGPEILADMLVPLGFFALVFGIMYMRSRENMALIERGINPRQGNVRSQPFVNLKYGLLLCGAGLGLLSAFLIDRSISHGILNPDENFTKHNPAIYFALIAIGGGLGLIISYLIEKKYWLDKKREE